MNRRAVFPLLFLAAFALLMPGCVGYNVAWNKAVSEYSSGTKAALVGPWIGDWETTSNGHTGNLRCIVTPVEGEPGMYNYHYHATWANVLAGGFNVKFLTQKAGSTYKVDGEQDLGIFGKFRHKATVSGNSFRATYEKNSGEEVGRFQMTRPN